MTATITNKALELIQELKSLDTYIRHFHIMVLSGLADDTSESPKRKIYQLILSKIVIGDKPEGYNEHLHFDTDNGSPDSLFGFVQNIPGTNTFIGFPTNHNGGRRFEEAPKKTKKFDYTKMTDREVADAFQSVRTYYSNTDPRNTNKNVHVDFDLSQNVMNRAGLMKQQLSGPYYYGQVYGVFIHEKELGYMAEYMLAMLNSRRAVLIYDLKKEGVTYDQ